MCIFGALSVWKDYFLDDYSYVTIISAELHLGHWVAGGQGLGHQDREFLLRR